MINQWRHLEVRYNIVARTRVSHGVGKPKCLSASLARADLVPQRWNSEK